MKTERELYSGLRSALDAHEKLPFSTIRAAIDQAQIRAAVTETAAKPKPFLARPIRHLAYGAACLVVLTVAGLFFLSDLSPTPNETVFLEESDNMSGEMDLYGIAEDRMEYAPEAAPQDNFGAAAGSGMDSAYEAADDLETGTKGAETASLNLSEALETLLQEYADQPDHVFAVCAQPPDERVMEESKSKQDTAGSAAIQYVTAKEIYDLVLQGYFLDVAPSSSETP